MYSDIDSLITDGELDYFFSRPTPENSTLSWKDSPPDVTARHLRAILEMVRTIDSAEYSAEKVKEVVWPYADQEGRGSVLWPMRYALSGKERSPDPFSLAGALGQHETCERLSAACDIVTETQ